LLKKNIEVTTGIKDSFGNRCIRLVRIADKELEKRNLRLSSNDNPSYSLDMKVYIHRIGHSDNFECEHCNQKGDIHFIKKHMCKKLDDASNSDKNTVQTFLQN
jgi:hypothetical protein